MLLNNVNDSLSLYDTYGLQDLNSANLMNRVDSKFLLPLSWLSGMLTQLESAYRVLDINGKRISNYKNQYLDTEFLKFYHDHHNGKLDRFKVRHREYLDTQTSFLEVKRKTNQRRTVKTRIGVNAEFFQDNNLSHGSEAPHFISNTVGIPLDAMRVTQHSGYQRIALANEKTAERLTIDFNLWYALDINQKFYLPNTCIAELKQARKTKNSPFYTLKESAHMSPISFSKYCIGSALLHKEKLKHNRFKPTLNKVGKLFQDNLSINSNFQEALEA